jgi:hypothetical protein
MFIRYLDDEESSRSNSGIFSALVVSTKIVRFRVEREASNICKAFDKIKPA